jgi:pyruvate/2-oxoglutarate dehydrogenase complex dihydrolipoamide acyltransferase (E2) component
MAEVISMPRFYDTMNEGVIFVLSKNVGDWVRKGDDLAGNNKGKVTIKIANS